MANEDEQNKLFAEIAKAVKKMPAELKEEFIATLDNQKKDGVITPDEAKEGFPKALAVLAKAEGKSLDFDKPQEKPQAHGIDAFFQGLADGVGGAVGGVLVFGVGNELGLKINDKSLGAGITALQNGAKPPAGEHDIPKGELPAAPPPVDKQPAKSGRAPTP